jgi:hypothetical protein
MRHNKIHRTDWTIVISGRVGPTGKTWLCNELVKAGYRATEHDQLTVARLLMDDGTNHVFVDERVNLVTVILNEVLPMYENKWCKVSDFDPTDVYTFDTRCEADHALWDMVDIADQYGVVTRADFMELVHRDCSYLDHKYGWLPDTIRKAQVIRLEHGYFINFPKALPID